MDELLDGIIPLAQIQGLKAMISGLGTGFTPQGIVASTDDLPASGELGDYYLVSSEGYAFYTWDNESEQWVVRTYNIATHEDIQEAFFS